MAGTIEELGRSEARWKWGPSWEDLGGPLWDEGLELRKAVREDGAVFRLLQGGREVGRLEVGEGVPALAAESAWAELLLREVLAEDRDVREARRLPLAA
jgi:hypothetical protein